jgi:ubiquitin-activating enzyme E1
VGSNKALAASETIRTANRALTVHPTAAHVGDGNAKLFGPELFDGLDTVVAAVDNVPPRLWLDEKCIAHQRPMLDAGMMGPLASVQAVVPFLSEPWSATRDPPDRETPVCTLKHFPYKTEHTVQWARELFDALFTARPHTVNAYLSEKGFNEALAKRSLGDQASTLSTLHSALVGQKTLSTSACIKWARLLFEDNFANNVKQLLYNFPRGMLTSTGTQFWTGTKRAPQVVVFDASDALHVGFVHAAANLQAAVYGLKGVITLQQVEGVVGGVQVPGFRPKEGVKISAGAEDAAKARSNPAGPSHGGEPGGGVEEDPMRMAAAHLSLTLPTAGELAGYRLAPVSFEADDAERLHLGFVLAAANCRAANYHIPCSDRLHCRRVAGGVLPALPTTASLAAALTCLEVYKLGQGAPLGLHRNTFASVAHPVLLRAEPLTVQTTMVQTSLGPFSWSLWDHIALDGRPVCTLQQLLDKFKAQRGLTIEMVSHGRSLLYASFLPLPKMQPRLAMTIPELVQTVGKTTIPDTQTCVTLSVSCEDANGQDVEVPSVKLCIR